MERGVDKVYPNREALERALKNPSKLTFYLGIDPTAPFLHLGHIIPVRKLEQLRQLGCKVILLIGGATATIGDPTDKTAVRKALTVKEVKENSKNYLKLLEPVLGLKSKKNPVKVRDNNEWWSKMKFHDYKRLEQRVTTQRLMERDMFQERIKAGAPIYLHELGYPLMQAYDSVAMKVDGEVGATDQTFNMLMGRDLVKSMQGRDKFVITVKLLTDPTGRKMGKTSGNAAPLDTNPADMYGAVMSWPDEVVLVAFELLTDVTISDVKTWQKKLGPRDFKAKLAFTITEIFHKKIGAEKAEAEFNKIFRSHGTPGDIKKIKLSGKHSAVELMVKAGLAASKSEARRIIEQGGLAIDDSIVNDSNEVIEIKKGAILRRGKRQFVQIE